MTLTERQARARLAKSIEAAGSQLAIASTLPLKPSAAQTAVSRSLLGRYPVHPAVMAYLGLRRDPKTLVIHDDAAPPATFRFLAVHPQPRCRAWLRRPRPRRLPLELQRDPSLRRSSDHPLHCADRALHSMNARFILTNACGSP